MEGVPTITVQEYREKLLENLGEEGDLIRRIVSDAMGKVEIEGTDESSEAKLVDIDCIGWEGSD